MVIGAELEHGYLVVVGLNDSQKIYDGVPTYHRHATCDTGRVGAIVMIDDLPLGGGTVAQLLKAAKRVIVFRKWLLSVILWLHCSLTNFSVIPVEQRLTWLIVVVIGGPEREMGLRRE